MERKSSATKTISAKKVNKTPKTEKTLSATKKTTGKIPTIKVSEKKKIIFLGSEAAPLLQRGDLQTFWARFLKHSQKIKI